jgi:hypothetical protein
LGASALAVVVLIFILFPSSFILKTVQRLALTGLVGIAALWFLLRSSDPVLRLMIMGGLITCIASFAGSDVGFGAYALYPLLLPFAAWSMQQRIVIVTGIVPNIWRTAFVFWWMIIVLVTLGLNLTYVYRDAPRADLSYAVSNEPTLRGILTNEARSNAVNGLVEATQQHIKSGSMIWATPDMPMVYFLTSTRPFTNHPWDNLYNAGAYEQMLTQSEIQRPLPAAVVTSKGTARHALWPHVIAPGAEHDYTQKEKIRSEFLTRHRYVKAWENNFFELWLPPAVE